VTDLKDAGEQAHDSAWLDRAIRLGLVVFGVIHLLVGWLALKVAVGDSSGSASSSGALHEVAAQPLGAFLVWVVAFGMAMLVLWRVLEMFHGHDGEDGADLWRKRATSAFKAVLYAVLAWSAVKVAVGDGSRGGTDSTTAQLMGLPGGQLVVGAVALGIIGYGLSLIRRAWTEKFREHLTAEGTSGEAGTAYVWAAKAGYSAKGVALIVIGALFGFAAWTHDAAKSGGLDVALQEIKQQPYGPWLLGMVAIGIGCYGLFCFARARHLSR
jgi:hypothetical protein